MLRRITTTLMLMLIGLGMLTANAQDGIPDNCEYSGGEYYRPNLFPRFELQNNRLVLVDWSTGQDVQILDSTNGAGIILGWSADCRYLAAAVGSYADSDTVVYDTVISTRVGSVDDAQGQPHHITWGVNSYLIVETRNGAILWNVPANTQITLTTSYDPYAARNFSRLRWDADHLQVVANLAVGGRVVYDLTTGQEIDLAASIVPNIDTAVSQNIVNVGGRFYQCNLGYFRWGTPNIDVHFDRQTSTLRIEPTFSDEVLVMLEADFAPATFQVRSWSSGCRYFAAAVDWDGRDVYDTIVWDIVENRRVAMFEDARQIPHPISWSPVDNIMLIETRHGAYLWDVATDTRTLINPNVETSLNGQSYVRSFRQTQWDASRDWLFGIPVQQQNAVYAYDIHTGEIVRSYVVDETDEPIRISFPFNANPDQITVYAPIGSTITFDKDTGERILPTSVVAASQLSVYERQTIPAANAPVNGESGFGIRLWQNCLPDSEIVYTQDRELVIRHLGTGETVQIEHDLNDTYGIWASPDCRYLAAQVSLTSNALVPYEQSPLDIVSQRHNSETFVMWDLSTRERVAEFPNPYRAETYVRVIWSPDSNWAFVRTTVAQWVVNLSARTSTVLFGNPLNTTNPPYILTYPNIYWDFSRGQMLVSGSVGVFAHDLYTGELRYVFSGDPIRGWGGSSFAIDANARNLYVGAGDRITIWDLDTYAFTQVDSQSLGSASPHQSNMAISPDGRYFVAGLRVIRVWDLSNMPADIDARDPIHFHLGPAGYIRSIRFIDNVTVETVSSDGIFRWNVETGEQLE